MNDPVLNHLVETAWHRPLTPPEEARLRQCFACHPEARSVWEEEKEVRRLLEELPSPPISSNFTSRVVQAVKAARPDPAVRGGPLWAWLRQGAWAYKAALAALVLVGGVFFRVEYEKYHRQQLARSLATVSNVAQTLPDVQMLQDFDAIRRLNQVPVEFDSDLLAALQ